MVRLRKLSVAQEGFQSFPSASPLCELFIPSITNAGNAYISLARVNYRRANSALELGDHDEANILKKQALIYDYQASEYFYNNLNIARKRNDQLGEMSFLLNLIPLANRTNQFNLAQAQLQQALDLFKQLSDSTSKVYAAIKLANFMDIAQKEAQKKTSVSIQKCATAAVISDSELTLKLLNQAISIAQRLQNFRALAFALGNLGHIYERRQEYQQALKLTQQAQWAAVQNLNAKNSLYLWEWQAGRIMKAQNKQESGVRSQESEVRSPVEAIAAYERAVAALPNIRSDMVSAHPDLQLDLRDRVESIYRELIELKLSLEDGYRNGDWVRAGLPRPYGSGDWERNFGVAEFGYEIGFLYNHDFCRDAINHVWSDDVHIVIQQRRNSFKIWLGFESTTKSSQSLVPFSSKKNDRSENLSYVLTSIDALKLAELQNYIGKGSIYTAVHQKRFNLVGAGTATAVFTSIILEARTAIIVSFPNGEKRLTWINLDGKSFKQKINEFRIGLEKRSDIVYNPHQAKKLYDWIVRPFANDLELWQIRTLVFIQDGILRSVPMAALHDGEAFLVQKYAIATTPSLTLTDPQTVKRQNGPSLAVGLTKDAIVDGRIYEALTNVGQEISQVGEQIKASLQLLDEDFTPDRLGDELRKTFYPIIHIATHGEFGSVPEDTFLVTGNNDKLTITDLKNIIGSVVHGSELVDLLALTACDTAMVDHGLAGVALQAGVRSVLASLWSINDAATVILVTKFYEQWCHSAIGKAEALGAAQKALIASGKKYAHPYYWAAFILVGNWL